VQVGVAATQAEPFQLVEAGHAHAEPFQTLPPVQVGVAAATQDEPFQLVEEGQEQAVPSQTLPPVQFCAAATQDEPFQPVDEGHEQAVPSQTFPPVHVCGGVVVVGFGSGSGSAGLAVPVATAGLAFDAITTSLWIHPLCSTPSAPVNDTSVKVWNSALRVTPVPAGSVCTGAAPGSAALRAVTLAVRTTVPLTATSWPE
jgi:hypothetical protein